MRIPSLWIVHPMVMRIERLSLCTCAALQPAMAPAVARHAAPLGHPNQYKYNFQILYGIIIVGGSV